MPACFFDKNVDAAEYKKKLRYVLLPWLCATFPPDVTVVFQQDGALAHRANVQQFLKRHIPGF